MTPEELKYIDDRFNAQKELLEAKFTHVLAETRMLIGDTNSRLDEIIKQNEIRNHRIEKSERKINLFEKEASIFKTKCAYIQEQKAKEKEKDVKEKEAEGSRKIKRAEWQRWAIGTLLIMLGIYITWFYKRETQRIPVELFFQKTDSTLHVPRMYFRNDETGTLEEVHVDYFKPEKN